MNATFLWHMEQVLTAYERPYNPKKPLICFDERPCQLLADQVVPLPMKAGAPRREDFHYLRHGTAVVLMAVEPLSGRRFVQVRATKKKGDYMAFMRDLERAYPSAQKITLIQDNLNTHNPSSFYENLDAREAFRLTGRFEMIYTPTRSSWLNMAEIELSALSKQCLDRRIGTIAELRRQVEKWTRRRNTKRVKIEWQFTKTKARKKFARFYSEAMQ